MSTSQGGCANSYASVGVGLFASSWCFSSDDAQGKCHFPLTLVITMVMLFSSDTTNWWCKSNKIALNWFKMAHMGGN